MTTFSAITIRGGIVPAGLLAHVQSGEVADRASLAPSSYHLAGRDTVRDAAARSWSVLRGAWEAWRAADAARTPGTVGTGPARERWLLPLLRELEYGWLPAEAGGITVEGDTYPVSHRWEAVPIHLLGPGVDLDTRNPGVAGAARAPQAMVQELLNRSDDHLWAILSNGTTLRLLRDSKSLAGSAYLQFDLAAIFDGELYPEFLLLWQLAHATRLASQPLSQRGAPATKTSDDEAPTTPGEAVPEGCYLERWRGEAVDAGTRALDKLRDGVEQALATLGTGFFTHPANRHLADALHTGTLTVDAYHRMLLRLVYRLLFVFVAEDRDALLAPTASAADRQRYRNYFSTARLRRLSRVRAGDTHGDLWQAQRLVLAALGGEGQGALGIDPLGGLFDPDDSLPTIAPADPLLEAELSNRDLLAAIRPLAWVRSDARGAARVQPVDYRHLGAEELGSVYESLLELVPKLSIEAHTFTLERAAGNDRKTTGSYYTPPGLVSALLDTALDPVIADAVKNADDAAQAEARLLALTVCDPACGSGGFLVAAARRIAKALAAARSGEREPTPDAVQTALHDVVARCIYGVDINPLAADLAKMSLWLEALQPGRPLSFLDARIKVGNALLGSTPALLAAGVPSEAFAPIEGDDKKFASAVKKRNMKELADTGQQALFVGTDEATVLAALASRREELVGTTATADDERRRAATYRDLTASEAYRARKREADAWTAAFVWPLKPGAPQPPTAMVARTLGDGTTPPTTLAEIDRLAGQYRFFHWHVEFPEVFGYDAPAADRGESGPDGWPGGFSCMLGNPPWERVKLQEQEFFAARDPKIAAAPNKAARTKLITALKDDDPVLYTAFLDARRQAEGDSGVLRTSGRYPLCGRGDVNTYAVFAELFRSLTGPHGQAGIIAPTGIATDATTQYFFKDLVTTSTLSALFDFENRKPIFEAVDSRFKFCLLTMTGRAEKETSAQFAFFLHDPAAIESARFPLTPAEITLLNPNTGTVPIFHTRRDAEITLGIYRRVPVLINENDPVNGNPWGVSFMRMFDMSNDSHLFHTREELEADGWVLHGNVFERPISTTPPPNSEPGTSRSTRPR